MHSKMLNQKMFEKWRDDFCEREYMKDKEDDEAFYEFYKAIYEQAVVDTEEVLRAEFENKEDDLYHMGYDDGYSDGLRDAD